jgi:hypothetical protein
MSRRSPLRLVPVRRIHPLERYLWERGKPGKRGIPLAEAAPLLGMSLRTLKDTIAWRHKPRVDRCERIAYLLGVPFDELFPEWSPSRSTATAALAT